MREDTVTSPLPRLTRRAFTDLSLWMMVLGILIGLAFPFVLIPLGVPSSVTLRPTFFTATVIAGLLVGGASQGVARLVVGSQLRQLGERMGYVAEVIADARYSGDWSACRPEDCALTVQSDDEIGDAAASFNVLLDSLASSRAVEDALSRHSRELAGHLDLDDLAEAAVASIATSLHAAAGALCLTQDGDVVVRATRRMDGAALAESQLVQAVLHDTTPQFVDVPEGLAIDAAAVHFRPAAVLVAPLRFKAEPLGALVLAFEQRPDPESVRLLDELLRPTTIALNNALAHDRFQRLAALDPLTRVYNRRFGVGRLKEEFARSLRYDTPLGLVMFDLDHFKDVNDTHGHGAGDQVLREVASTVRGALREGDVLIRYGGEEFLILLPSSGSQDVAQLAERLRRLLAGLEIHTSAGRLTITASFGGASYPTMTASRAEDLVEHADRALYRSKNLGRDRVTMAREAPVEAG